MKKQTTVRSDQRRAVIYTRVSTESQGEGYSLPTQLEGCRTYAAELGYTVLETFEDQHTGTELDRPGLNALLTFAHTTPVDVVIVYDIDRLSRMAASQAILETELANLGTRVEYVIGRYADTPEGELAKLIKAAIAQYENRQRVERSNRGRKGKARAGYVVLSQLRTPYGYDLVSEPHKAWLVVNDVEAAIVRKMFEWALSGMSSYAIARELSEWRVPTRGDTRTRILKKVGPGMWDPATVRSMLRNPVYKGEWTYYKNRTVRRQGKVRREALPAEEQIVVATPAIVDAAAWEAVQLQLKRNQQYSRRNAKREYLLRGIIRCSCGVLWRGYYKAHLGRAYYRCPSSEGRPWAPACTVEGGVRQDRLEDAIWAAVEAKLLDPDYLRAELAQQRAMADQVREERAQRLKAIDDASVDVHRRLGILLDQVLVAGFSNELLEDRKRMLVAQLHDLQAEQARAKVSLESVTLDPSQELTILGFAEQVRAGLKELTPTAKRTILELLQVQIEVISQTEFRVTALIPIGDRVDVPRLKRASPRRSAGGGDADGATVSNLIE